VGAAETYEFCLGFLRSLVARGLKKVRLVTSGAHEGLRRATGAVQVGATWQRCRLHFVRNVPPRLPEHIQYVVAAVVCALFAHASLLSLPSAGGGSAHPVDAGGGLGPGPQEDLPGAPIVC